LQAQCSAGQSTTITPSPVIFPEVLIAIASNFDTNESFIAATHVCHFWGSTFVSSPRLWSNIVFENEEQDFSFLARSKSAPVSLDLFGNIKNPSETAKLSVKRIANKVTSLRAAYFSFPDELLVQPLPILRTLVVYSFPSSPQNQLIRPLSSVRSLTIVGHNLPLFHVPHLTNFVFELANS
jgi:hypothetical protein